jgi:apolipoprotein N-acyltransferase
MSLSRIAVPLLPDLVALVCGLLLPLAFAPFDYPFTALVALAGLFGSWLEAKPGQAFRRGYWFGLGQFGFGFSWIYISIHDFGGASVFEAVGLTALLSMFLALYPAIAGWVATRFFSTGPVLRVIGVFPAVWILTEWVRGWLFSGLPWLQVGYTQIDTPLAGLYPVFGVYGVGWATALLAGMLLSAPQWSFARQWRGVAGVAAVIGVGAGLGHIPWTSPAGEPFKVALIQGNMEQETKWRPETLDKTVQVYLELTRRHWDAKLIVWPETAVPAFYQKVKDSYFADLQAEAKSRGTDLLIGLPYYNQTHDRYYNALVSVGETPGFYFKRHLVPFGEFLPLRPLLGWVLEIVNIPLADFASGDDHQPPLMAAGYRLGASICFEDIFGAEVLTALPEAAYLVNVTNDTWFGDSIAPHQHVQMARARALETGRWMARATNTGVTAFIDPKGDIVSKARMFEAAELKGTITPMRGSTPYALWGNAPAIAGPALLLAGMVWRRRLRPESRQ